MHPNGAAINSTNLDSIFTTFSATYCISFVATIRPANFGAQYYTNLPAFLHTHCSPFLSAKFNTNCISLCSTKHYPIGTTNRSAI